MSERINIPYLKFKIIISDTSSTYISQEHNYVYHSYNGFVYDAL